MNYYTIALPTLFLDGDSRNDSKINKSVMLASIKFIYSSKRFDG